MTSKSSVYNTLATKIVMNVDKMLRLKIPYAIIYKLKNNKIQMFSQSRNKTKRSPKINEKRILFSLLSRLEKHRFFREKSITHKLA